jgi:hypothetical protein
MSAVALPNPAIARAVEQRDYRVTVGDVATTVGLDVRLAEQGLMVLAAEVGGHLQVAEDGEIAYVFPRRFRAILRNRFWRVRLQEQWQRVWGVLFYLIRISFGIVLIGLIVAVLVALAVAIAVVSLSDRDGDSGGSSGNSRGGPVWIPNVWIGDWFWWFAPDPVPARRQRSTQHRQTPNRNKSDRSSVDQDDLNFLEAVFSFLFGDGNPNADLEERRWQAIAIAIRHHRGVITAEQLAPYLDDFPGDPEDEDYVLPALVRFNGQPQVSPEGDLVYCFPELQVTAQEAGKTGNRQIRDSTGEPARHPAETPPAFLQEQRWIFSQASTGQKIAAGALGGVLLILAAMLGSFVGSNGAELAELGLSGLLAGLATVSIGYSAAYLLIPLGRFFWLQRHNRRLEERNRDRQDRAIQLQAGSPTLDRKLAYAQQFARQNVIDANDLAYSTDQDLILQEFAKLDKTDTGQQRRLDESNNANP